MEISKGLNMVLEEFIQVYCRWVDWDGGARLSLKEKASFDCIFWKDGCLIYESRPIQCRTYPFWAEMLDSLEVWEHVTEKCPGAGSGVLVSREFIEASAELDRSNIIMSKSC